jgi:AraC family transcriptional regulator of adaptative response/methylated-DNA-[protein]-cysteine methyltransferase
MEIDYARIEKAIRYLDENFRRQPDLSEVAAAVGLSDFHFQRLFSRWAGVSPKRFLQFLTAEYARGLLLDSSTVLDAAFAAGLSGPGRLHDLLVSVDGVTPGETRSRGAGLTIRYGEHPTPFGDCLIAATERGVCAMSFNSPDALPAALGELQERWSSATLVADPAATAPIARGIFGGGDDAEPVRLHLVGTNFQIRVWEALLRIPDGSVVTYEQLAQRVGAPAAARAVGTAVGRNPIAYVIPCHRVIRKTGAFGEYRWGAVRKRAMLGWEAARGSVAPRRAAS